MEVFEGFVLLVFFYYCHVSLSLREKQKSTDSKVWLDFVLLSSISTQFLFTSSIGSHLFINNKYILILFKV